jgi:hypothetical protein
VKIPEEVGRKGAERLGRLSQPLSHRVRGNLEDPGGGADAQPFSQTGHHSHDQLHCRLCAMAKRAVGSHVRRDRLVSVMYSEELNSTTSSVSLQRTDRHGIVD